MANYKTHSVFNLFLALPLIIGAWFYFFHLKWNFAATFSLAFIYATLFMNPDLDLANKIKLISIRGLLTLPFRSYAKVFSHRGMSHVIIIGTVTRILWLAIWAAGIFFILYHTLPNQRSILVLFKAYKPFIFSALAGLIAADLGHLLLDLKKS